MLTALSTSERSGTGLRAAIIDWPNDWRRFCRTETVTDARVIQDYYRARYGTDSTMIAYGAEVERRPDPLRAALARRTESLRALRFASRA